MSTMSQVVPALDLTPYTVGQIGRVDLSATIAKVPNFDRYDPILGPGHMRIYNDSGTTLQIDNDTGTISDYVPAGAWPTYELEAGSYIVRFKVVSLLPNPPVNLLMITLYGPGEKVPDTPQLGNSPVGIGGTVQTSSVQTLSNEGSAKTQLVIDIGDSALAQLITINNDGTTTWKVDVASVAHTILAIAAAGNLLKLGQAGDTTEVLGKLTVDQLLLASLGLSAVGGTTTDTLSVTSTSVFTGEATFSSDVKSNTYRDNVTGADQLDMTTNGSTFNKALALAAKQLLDAVGGNLLADWTVAGVNFNGNQGNKSRFAYFSQIGTAQPDWSLHGIAHNNFSGSASGTFNHNLLFAGVAATPSQYFFNPSSAAGSQTFGVNTPTTTTVAVVIGASNTFSANAVGF